jgi:hypothetical protein
VGLLFVDVLKKKKSSSISLEEEEEEVDCTSVADSN